MDDVALAAQLREHAEQLQKDVELFSRAVQDWARQGSQDAEPLLQVYLPLERLKSALAATTEACQRLSDLARIDEAVRTLSPESWHSLARWIKLKQAPWDAANPPIMVEIADDLDHLADTLEGKV